MVMDKTQPIPIHAAKTHLSRLVERALAGEDIVISRGSTPVVRLVPVEPVPRRVPGRWKGVLGDCDAVLEPLPEDELAAWEGG